MSRRSISPKLELNLNLSPPRANSPEIESPNASSGSSTGMSIDGSCVSSDSENQKTIHYNVGSPDEATSMVLVGCLRCLMYVMLSRVDPKCPKCKSTVLLDFFGQPHHSKTT